MINFMKYKYLYFAFSLLFIIPGAYFLIRFGLKPALDFTGGTLLELSINPKDNQTLTTDSLKPIIEPIIPSSSLQQVDSRAFIIRSQQFDQPTNQKLQTEITAKIGETQEKRFETIGPTLGKELIRKTIVGILLASGFILF